MDEALNVKVLVEQFVFPWVEAPHVHSWLDIRKATTGSGVRGLGVMSGATKVLAMGGHGDTLVSAKDALCHAHETLEEALKPSMRKQSAINAFRLKRFVIANAPRHHNSYKDLPLRQGGGRAVSYPQAVEISWKHPSQVSAASAQSAGASAADDTAKKSGGGLWDAVWQMS